ncbi:MAG: YkvA family protein [Polyangiaceae bacterium]
MSDLNQRCLDTFPEWLKALATDATELALLLSESDLPESSRRFSAAALNYLFKSLDLIPDGIEDLGYLDDAFVLRVAARFATKGVSGEVPAVLTRLAADVPLVEELLGVDYPRLAKYVDNLQHGAARGRTAEDIVAKEEVRAAFLAELRAWADAYDAPSFTRDEKNITKLQSFLSAKLPG